MEGVVEEVPAQKKLIKEHDSTYVKIAKSGGHSGTVIVTNNSIHTVIMNDSQEAKL